MISPAEGVTCTLHLSYGTHEASWANNYNTLIIAYVKTGGLPPTSSNTVHVKGQGYFAIEFNYNDTGD